MHCPPTPLALSSVSRKAQPSEPSLQPGAPAGLRSRPRRTGGALCCLCMPEQELRIDGRCAGVIRVARGLAGPPPGLVDSCWKFVGICRLFVGFLLVSCWFLVGRFLGCVGTQRKDCGKSRAVERMAPHRSLRLNWLWKEFGVERMWKEQRPTRNQQQPTRVSTISQQDFR